MLSPLKGFKHVFFSCLIIETYKLEIVRIHLRFTVRLKEIKDLMLKKNDDTIYISFQSDSYAQPQHVSFGICHSFRKVQ